MSTERLVEGIAKLIDRRRFLARAAGSSLAGVAAVMGPSKVHGVRPATGAACCNLCYGDSGSCTGCACIWCWACCFDGYYWNCCECHSATSDCGKDCNNVICSYSELSACCC